MRIYTFLLIAILGLLAACGQSETATTEPSTPSETVAETPVEVDPVAMLRGEVAEATMSEAGEVAGAAEGSTTYVVDTDASQVYWRGAKVAYDHYGTLSLAEGSFSVTDGQLSGGSISMDMTSIKNLDIEDEKKNGDLVGHLMSDDFFSVESHPLASFEITGITSAETGSTISGNLTIKGITHQVSFPAEISMDGEGMSATALFSFDRAKYDVQFNSGSFFENLGDKLILDQIGLYLDLKAAPEVMENAG